MVTPERKTQAPIGPAYWTVWAIPSSRLRLGEQDQSGMLMSVRLISCRLTHRSHQDSCPFAHGSHLTANKVPNSRERSRFRGIEESDRTTEACQEDGQKTKQEG
ncbi:hypothetical protein ElyMa_006160500 [Elysia marginata]|uniref:Uncharacterized protein n=1 Tax=Elysia marginata TaxID=1093978 RepID=A0AAV4GYQ7_9GAST|nr:hypothetical protein ElyMa_006160500 [Elysia marginata]